MISSLLKCTRPLLIWGGFGEPACTSKGFFVYGNRNMNTEDKELLELAAKAAGVEVEWRNGSGCFYYDDPVTGREEWSPLDDDGQALRLAVKLGLQVYGREIGGSIEGFDVFVDEADCGNDPYAAARRAIVRAAAEIGRLM